MGEGPEVGTKGLSGDGFTWGPAADGVNGIPRLIAVRKFSCDQHNSLSNQEQGKPGKEQAGLAATFLKRTIVVLWGAVADRENRGCSVCRATCCSPIPGSQPDCDK